MTIGNGLQNDDVIQCSNWQPTTEQWPDSYGVSIQVAFVPHALEAHAVSLAARRLSEQVCSDLVGTPVRVATLLPSGRPIAWQQGGVEPCLVSISHTHQLLSAIACRGAVGAGVDLVSMDRPGLSFSWCFTQFDTDGSVSDSRLTAIRLWAAKEAAYKASRIDIGFQPRRVHISGENATCFKWTLSGDHEIIRGIGIWKVAEGHVIAIAVQPTTDQPMIDKWIAPAVQRTSQIQ